MRTGCALDPAFPDVGQADNYQPPASLPSLSRVRAQMSSLLLCLKAITLHEAEADAMPLAGTGSTHKGRTVAKFAML